MPSPFPRPLVVYYEKRYHPLMNAVLSERSRQLRELLSDHGYTLVYFPNWWGMGVTDRPRHLSQFRYFQPEYRLARIENLAGAVRTFSAPWFLQVVYRALHEVIGTTAYPEAGFLVVDESGKTTATEFSSIAEDCLHGGDPPGMLEKALLEHFDRTFAERGQVFFTENRAIRYHPDESRIVCHKDLKAKKPDPEKAFEEEDLRVSLEIEMELQLWLQGENAAVAADLLLRVLRKVKLSDPRLAKELEALLEVEINTGPEKLSRLRLQTSHGGYDYRILLSDYDLEVDMPQLPKALYLFFLRHPGGVMLKDLPDHKAELLSVYSRIASLSDPETIKENIDRLTDLSDNSVHVNCARIKKAFLEKVTDRVARHYYITGKRGKAKRVALPEELLDVDPALLEI